jgi:hypothetical protein
MPLEMTACVFPARVHTSAAEPLQAAGEAAYCCPWLYPAAEEDPNVLAAPGRFQELPPEEVFAERILYPK